MNTSFLHATAVCVRLTYVYLNHTFDLLVVRGLHHLTKFHFDLFSQVTLVLSHTVLEPDTLGLLSFSLASQLVSLSLTAFL